MIKNHIKLMRPYQWVKNLFCFAGVVFGLHFHEINLIVNSIKVFVAFSFAASAVYVLNDIFDIDLDQSHPKKKYRPLASGLITVKSAYILSIALVLVALLLAYNVNAYALMIIGCYILVNLYYSKYGKHVVILDVFIISFGFLLRIISGTSAIGIPQSDWLILCAITLTLLLGFAKRRAELLQCEQLHADTKLKRAVLEHYDSRMLDIFIAVTAASSILSYNLFVIIGKNIHGLVYTAVFVIYGVFRYVYILYRQDGGQDTANDLLDDRHLIITVALWIICYLAITLW